MDLGTVNAHSVSGNAPHRTRRHAAGAPYDRSRRSHNHTTISKQDVDTMQAMTLDAAEVLKGALEAAASMHDVDVDALASGSGKTPGTSWRTNWRGPQARLRR